LALAGLLAALSQLKRSSATRGRVSDCCDCSLNGTQPDVLPSVSYQAVRRW